MKTKIKSYAFWTALSAAAVILINSLGKVFGFSVEESIVTNLIMAVCGVLVVFGIVKSPKEENDEDDENQEKK